jgi:hypothetical protein
MCIIPDTGKFTYRSFMSNVINFILFVVCSFSNSWATCCEFSIVCMCGKLSMFFNLLFIKRAILYDGACMMFITGRMG